jgi:hypothetical protein
MSVRVGRIELHSVGKELLGLHLPKAVAEFAAL